MAKVKNKRNNGIADKVHNKRKTEANKKKLNPFEVHINREKIKVLGKKSKHDKGLPGVSRAKAIQKRKETLGTEMKLMNKTNSFIDRRIGEKDGQLSAEDRMIARFAAERVKQHSKKNIYNLADDEVLTHRGQTLEQIEKFDDPRSDDEDEEGMGKGFGGLDDDFVSDGHFGGGMLSKTDSRDGAKSHKDLIEQLIAESKKRKAEKQKEKEQTLDLTEKLDSEWKDLQPVVFKRQKVEEESLIDKVLSKADKQSADYDKMMRELRFEKRGTPSDGLKSDEKQAKEERAKLEQWERDLKQRMEGEEVKKSTPTAKHRSAEDLDDNFELDDEKEFMLAYDKDGKPLVPEHVLKDYSVPNAKPKFEDGVSDTSDDDDGDDDDESDESDDDKAKNKTENAKSQSNNESDSEDDEESDDDEETDDGDVKPQTSEVKKPATEEKNINSKAVNDNSPKANQKNIETSKKEKQEVNTKTKSEQNPKPEVKAKEESILFPNGKDESDESSDDDDNDDEEESDDDEDEEESDEDVKEPKKDDFKDLKESDDENEVELDSEDTQKKINCFFDQKTVEGDNLKELLCDKTPAQQSVALHKLIKRYDPSLSENNKEYLSRLFANMLQLTNELFTKITDEGSLLKAFLTFDRLVPYFYDLAKTNKVSTKKFLIEIIKEKRDKYMKNPRIMPDLDTLIFFKLVSLLYPTSDFRHPVTTPSLIFMSEILTLSKFHDAFSISRGIFLTALILEFTVLSKRLVPSALNFLRGVLYLAANTSILNPIQVVPPFKTNRDAKILNISADCSKMTVVNKMLAKDLVANEITDDFKVRSLLIATRMTKEFFDNLSDLEAQECLFESHIKLLGRVELENYPVKVNKLVSEIVKDMKDSLEVKTYTPLSREKKRPKALRLYEPDVQEVFTGSRNAKLSREDADRRRLQTKYKKEMKGALREIRRDKAYIASVKIKQKIASDNIRKDKVKQIYKDASIQQGELNKLKRIK